VDSPIRLTVNGREHRLVLPPNTTLLTALRDLGYTDVKSGCESGECGACAVLLNGKAVNSCLVLAQQADGAEVVTDGGLGTMKNPHPIQEAFADAGAVQCGFCTPGMIVSTKALLDRNPDPTDAEIREALSGNLCRCTGYGQIVAGVRLAAERLRQSASSPASSLAETTTASEDGREVELPDRLLVEGDETEAGGEA
jgi:carbon-monoxide dehydrogenase small subunit